MLSPRENHLTILSRFMALQITYSEEVNTTENRMWDTFIWYDLNFPNTFLVFKNLLFIHRSK